MAVATSQNRKKEENGDYVFHFGEMYLVKKGRTFCAALLFYAANFCFLRLIWFTSDSKALSKDSSNDLEETFTKKL